MTWRELVSQVLDISAIPSRFTDGVLLSLSHVM